jgi:AcrR family transcriptional regulator
MPDEPHPPPRERLLAATVELTYAGGVEATGVEAIARRAGTTKRTLYQQFGSKDALVGEALARLDGPATAVLRGAVERRVARGALPVDALFATLARLFAGEAFRGCAFVNAGLEVADRAHPLHAAVRSHVDGRRALASELCAAEGVEDPAVVEGVALLVEGAFVLAATRRDPEVAVRAGRAARRLLDGAR